MKQTIELKEFTAKQAEEFLRKHNTNNRPLYKKHVAYLAYQMKEGLWKENTGETIKVSRTGVLLDGQHRLSGQVKSGKTLRWQIAFNIPDESMEVLDTGKPRRPQDVLALKGVTNPIATSAIIRNYLVISSGSFDFKTRQLFITNTKIIDEYENNPERWNEIVRQSHQFYKQIKRDLKQSYIGAWLAYLSETEPEEIELFFIKLCEGIGFKTSKDPIKILKDILVLNSRSEKRLTPAARNAYFIITWNSFLQGREYDRIPYVYKKDDFPKLYKTKREALEAYNKEKKKKIVELEIKNKIKASGR